MATRGFLVGDQSIRPRRTTRFTSSKQARTTKRKKKKPEWDSTVNDLNVHKATREEQAKRHELHKSKNVTKGQRNREEPLDLTLQTPDTAERRKLAIVQEILYGQDKLQDVLSESDRTMSVVRDLFGDDPKKYMGFPNVTAAPGSVSHSKGNRLTVGPVPQETDTPTHLSLLSDSVMRTPALNELSHESKDDEETSPGSTNGNEDSAGGTIPQEAFESKLDLQRFHRYVAEERSSHLYHAEAPQPHVHSQASGGPAVTHGTGNHSVGVAGGRGPTHEVPHGHVAVRADSQPSSFLSQESAATVIAGGPTFVRPALVSNGQPTTVNPNSQPHVKSNKGKVGLKSGDKKPPNSATSGLQSLEDFKKMVDALENEVAEYEYETGRQPTKLSATSGNFGGYTAALITAITKLMAYLKESEIQKRAEMALREELLQGFAEQRALVDALTNDILHTQEQNFALQHDFLAYRRTTDEQLQYLKRELYAVLKSYEYQALSSSINTLYDLNPVSLKKGEERHNFEYLPGAPAAQSGSTHEGRMEGDNNGAEMNYIGERLIKEPSFIPVATTQGHNRERSSPQRPARLGTGQVPLDHRVNGHTESVEPVSHISMETGHAGQQKQGTLQSNAGHFPQPYEGSIPHFVDQGPGRSIGEHHNSLSNVGHYSQPHEGPVPHFVYQGPGRSIGEHHDSTGHVLLGSDIHLYPPRQDPVAGLIDVGLARVQPPAAPYEPSAPQNRLSSKVLMEDPPPPTRGVVPPSTSLNSAYQGHLQYRPAANVPQETLSPTSSGPQAVAVRNLSPRMPQSRPGTVSSLQGPGAASPRFFADPRSLKQVGPVNQNSASLHHLPQGGDAADETKVPSGYPLAQQLHQILNMGGPSGNALASTDVGPSGQSKGFGPISRIVIGGQPPNQLRERLQNLANRQKSLVAKRDAQDASSGMTRQVKGAVEAQQPQYTRTSPHVRFQEPLVVVNKDHSGKEQGQQSPPDSPIPYKNLAAVNRSSAPPEKRVVVNLPNAWSDVSSTVSL